MPPRPFSALASASRRAPAFDDVWASASRRPSPAFDEVLQEVMLWEVGAAAGRRIGAVPPYPPSLFSKIPAALSEFKTYTASLHDSPSPADVHITFQLGRTLEYAFHDLRFCELFARRGRDLREAREGLYILIGLAVSVSRDATEWSQEAVEQVRLFSVWSLFNFLTWVASEDSGGRPDIEAEVFQECRANLAALLELDASTYVDLTDPDRSVLRFMMWTVKSVAILAGVTQTATIGIVGPVDISSAFGKGIMAAVAAFSEEYNTGTVCTRGLREAMCVLRHILDRDRNAAGLVEALTSGHFQSVARMVQREVCKSSWRPSDDAQVRLDEFTEPFRGGEGDCVDLAVEAARLLEAIHRCPRAWAAASRGVELRVWLRTGRACSNSCCGFVRTKDLRLKCCACGAVRYCSVACQKACWPVHKLTCASVQRS